MKTTGLKRFAGALVSVLMVGSSFVLGGALTASAATTAPKANVTQNIDCTQYSTDSMNTASTGVAAGSIWTWSFSSKTLTLINMTMTGTAKAATPAINLPDGSTVVLVGTNSITPATTANDGIYSAGKLTFSGSGSLTIAKNATNAGIEAKTSVTFGNTGTITATGATAAIATDAAKTGAIVVSATTRVTDPGNAFEWLGGPGTVVASGTTPAIATTATVAAVSYNVPKSIPNQPMCLGTTLDLSTSLSTSAYTLSEGAAVTAPATQAVVTPLLGSDKTTIIGVDASASTAAAGTQNMIATFAARNNVAKDVPAKTAPVGVMTSEVKFAVVVNPIAMTLNPNGGVTYGNAKTQNFIPGVPPTGGFTWTGDAKVSSMGTTAAFNLNTTDPLYQGIQGDENANWNYGQPWKTGYMFVGWAPSASVTPVDPTAYPSKVTNANGYWDETKSFADNVKALKLTPNCNMTLYAIWMAYPAAMAQFPVYQVVGSLKVTMDQPTAKTFDGYYAISNVTESYDSSYNTILTTEQNGLTVDPGRLMKGFPMQDSAGRYIADGVQSYTFQDNLMNATPIAKYLSWNQTTQQITMKPGAPVGTYAVKFTITNKVAGVSYSDTKAIEVDVTVGPPTQIATRLGGTDRFATAVAIANNGWKTSNTVYLAVYNNFPDALAAVPLAAINNAPILLTQTNSVPAGTMAQIKALGATNAVLLGDTGVISNAVVSQLKAAGISSSRLGGTTRYDTDAKIAAAIEAKSGSKAAFVVSGTNFPDALSIASVAGISGTPVVYANATGLPQQSIDFLKNSGITSVVIVGGPAVTGGANTVSQLNDLGISNSYVYGANRYTTSSAIASKYASLFGSNVTLATGLKFPDALTGAVLSAQLKAPMLLVDANQTNNAKSYISGVSSPKIYVYGDTGAVTDVTVSAVAPSTGN